MTAPALEKSAYDVLNAVALKKMATAAVVADVSGLPEAEVSTVLAGLAERELVVMVAGSALPSDDAEPGLAAAAAQHYAAVRADDGIAGLVERFETVNTQLLATMSAWQQVDVGGRKIANDHTDSEYDDRIITRIGKLVGRLTPLLDALAAHDPRFALYPRRFAAALEAVDGGRHELVSSPTLDSVHTIWFEFHEDLLRTLGRERTE